MIDKDPADAEASAARMASAEDGQMNAGATSTPKRRFWQIHLSTALVLMFLASGMLWFNVNSKEVRRLDIENRFMTEAAMICRGWPFCALVSDPISYEVYWEGVLLNVLCAGIVLGFAAVSFESVMSKQLPFRLRPRSLMVSLGLLGALVALNIVGEEAAFLDISEFKSDLLVFGRNETYLETWSLTYYGWPTKSGLFMCGGYMADSYWYSLHLIANLGTALLIISSALILSELLIRRREARKP